MATDVLNGTAEQTATATSLVTGIVHDAQELFKQQLHLLQIEVKTDLRKTTEASIALLIGTATALVGAILLAFGLVEAASYVMPRWAAFGLIGLIVSVIGGVLIAGALTAFNKIHPTEQSAEALKETMQWQTKPN